MASQFDILTSVGVAPMTSVFVAVRDVELKQTVFGTVYGVVKNGVNQERTENISVGAEGSPFLIFNSLLPLIVENSNLQVGIYQLSNGFTDDVIGESLININSPSEDNRYPLTIFNKTEGIEEVIGSIYVSIEVTKFEKKGAKEFLLGASVEDLRTSNIGSKATKSITNLIKETIKSNSPMLDLSGLQLESCPPEMTQIAVTTKVLDMGFNRFSQYPDVSYLGFQYLEEFTLTGNLLEFLPPSISQLTKLLVLNLNGNLLRELPKEIGKLYLLEKLDLSNNQLTKLLPEIGYLTNLQDLMLSGNKIQTLPRSIGRCINMEVMDLSSCDLNALPNEFTKMTKLMELNLGNNHLSQLPSNIGRMTHLVSLNLSDNSLHDLPLSIGYCQGLVQCYLDRNPIQDPKILSNAKMGADYLADYLETRMLSYMSDRGINPNAMQEQMEQQERMERQAKLDQQREQEEALERKKEEEELRVKAAIEEERQRMLAMASPQEQAILAKLNQAKNMGTMIFTDCLNRVTNLEMFVGQVNSIRAGLPFSRTVDSLVADNENVQRVIGYQREPAVPRVAVGFASPQLQNFKHGILIKLAHTTVCITAAVPFLQDCDDAQQIVSLVKLARSMNYKLTNIM